MGPTPSPKTQRRASPRDQNTWSVFLRGLTRHQRVEAQPFGWPPRWQHRTLHSPRTDSHQARSSTIPDCAAFNLLPRLQSHSDELDGTRLTPKRMPVPSSHPSKQVARQGPAMNAGAKAAALQSIPSSSSQRLSRTQSSPIHKPTRSERLQPRPSPVPQV